MVKKISAAIRWRIRYTVELFKRLKWNLKYKLSDSASEKIEGITLVVVGRNDNYGGDFSLRLKTTIDWNYNHLPNPELIYIEWNPIEDRPSDCDWIAERYPNSKCYIVPKEIHEMYCSNPKLPVMEYFAKNLGIKKASNDWVLLVNADVLLGLNTIKNIGHLNKKYVYSAHYNNINWDNQPIEERHLKDKSKVLTYYSSNTKLGGLVGNMILAHKEMWFKAKGYDERLTDVRNGVDVNGLLQLFYCGALPMVLGDHYHLDHQESLIHGANTTHGVSNRIIEVTTGTNVPYKNPEDWGLSAFNEVQRKSNIWEIKKERGN